MRKNSGTCRDLEGASGFLAGIRALPADIQRQARKQFALFESDPMHPSLHFKKVAPGVYSGRVDRSHRALARVRGDLVVWYWIGPHDEYERLLDAM